jgi:hypothetical protein
MGRKPDRRAKCFLSKNLRRCEKPGIQVTPRLSTSLPIEGHEDQRDGGDENLISRGQKGWLTCASVSKSMSTAVLDNTQWDIGTTNPREPIGIKQRTLQPHATIDPTTGSASSWHIERAVRTGGFRQHRLTWCAGLFSPTFGHARDHGAQLVPPPLGQIGGCLFFRVCRIRDHDHTGAPSQRTPSVRLRMAARASCARTTREIV